MSVPSQRGKAGGFDLVERETYYAAIRRGIFDGLSDREVARRVGVSVRTVLRYRGARSIANFYQR